MFTDVSMVWDSVVSLKGVSSVPRIPIPMVQAIIDDALSCLFNPLSLSFEQRVNAYLALQKLAYGGTTTDEMGVIAEAIARNHNDFAGAICGFASFLSGPPGKPAHPPQSLEGYKLVS